MRSSKALLASCVAVSSLGAVSVAGANRLYELIELPMPGSFALGYGINDRGQVVGEFEPDDDERIARVGLWELSPWSSQAPQLRDLGRAEPFASAGTAISRSGTIVGVNRPGVGFNPIKLTHVNGVYGPATPVGPVPANVNGRLGRPVGYDDASGQIAFDRGFVWTPGAGDPQVVMGEIDDVALTGQNGRTVVGFDNLYAGYRARMWDPVRGTTDLHAITGGVSSTAEAIASNGIVAGTAFDFLNGNPVPNFVHARGPGSRDQGEPPRSWVYVYTPENTPDHEAGVKRLDGLEFVAGVNRHGHVFAGAGEALDYAPALHRDGRITTLNDLVRRSAPAKSKPVEFGYYGGMNDHGDMLVGIYDQDYNLRPAVVRVKAPAKHEQNGGDWANDRVLGGTESMKNVGCFVTTTAMMLQHHGHNVDPGQLNRFLKPSFENTSYINFARIPTDVTSYGQTDGNAGTPVTFMGATIAGSTRAQRIERLTEIIQRDGPVLFRVPMWNAVLQEFNFNYTAYVDAAGVTRYTGGTHAVLAYRGVDGDVLVRNPGSVHSGQAEPLALTLSQYIAYEIGRRGGVATGLSNDLSWLSGVTFARPSELAEEIVGSVNSPVEMVVTDALGRRLGFDPTANGGAGAFYNEIPDSYYARQVAIADPDGNTLDGIDEYLPIEFTIGQPVDGQYTYQIFSLDNGTWSIDLNYLRGGTDDERLRFSGIADPTARPTVFSAYYSSVVPEPTLPLLASALLMACMHRRRSTVD